MRYIPKPFENPTPAGAKRLAEGIRHDIRRRLARNAKVLAEALWAIDDAEAQLRWARADNFSAEALQECEDKVDQAYALVTEVYGLVDRAMGRS